MTQNSRKQHDKRVVRTESSLRQAFSQLIAEKPYSEITVKELCERSKINKSTFYLHYQDLYDFQVHLRDLIIDYIIEIFLEYEYTTLLEYSSEILYRIVHLFDGNAPLYFSFTETPQLAHLLSEIDDTIVNIVIAHLKERRPNLSEEELALRRVYTTFLVNGYIGLIKQYTLDQITKEQLDSLAQCLGNGFER